MKFHSIKFRLNLTLHDTFLTLTHLVSQERHLDGFIPYPFI